MKWLRDEDFIRGQVPMTKYNIRALIMAYLEINEGDRLLDVGGGTGSVSIEASLQGAEVVTIESEDKALEVLQENINKFQVELDLVKGYFPEDMEDRFFDKVFIGGSRKRLEAMFDYFDRNLRSRGFIVATFIMLKNLNEFLELLDRYDYQDIEVNLVQTSKLDRLGLLRGENPIFIVRGVKL